MSELDLLVSREPLPGGAVLEPAGPSPGFECTLNLSHSLGMARYDTDVYQTASRRSIEGPSRSRAVRDAP